MKKLLFLFSTVLALTLFGSGSSPHSGAGGGGSGDVVGPGTSDDDGVARFDGATGKLIKDSKWEISDTGQLQCKVDADCDIGADLANRPNEIHAKTRHLSGQSTLLSTATLPGTYAGDQNDVISFIHSDETFNLGGIIGFWRSDGDSSFFQSERNVDVTGSDHDLDVYFFTNQNAPFETGKRLKLGHDGSLTLNYSNLFGANGGYLRNTKAIDYSEQASTPATPATGESSLYFKADSELYKLDDLGTEVQLSSGPHTTDTDTQTPDTTLGLIK